MEEIALEIVPDKRVDTAVQLSVEAEKRGFSNVWVTDHYNHHGVWPILAAIASQTDRIMLGPGVTNPYTTNPCAIASSIATINEISKGRGILGIGAGDASTLESMGINRKKPVTGVREAVQIIRGLLNGRVITQRGSVFSAESARLDISFNGESNCSMDIYIGAQGPQMLETAAVIGDGILLNASHPLDVEAARNIIAKRRETIGDKTDSLKLICYSSFCLLEKGEDIPLESKIVVAYIVAGSSQQVLERHEIDMAKKRTIRDSLQKGNYISAAKNVNRRMLESFAVIGSSDECISRIAQLSEAGIDQFVVGSPIGTDRMATVSRIGNEILTQFT